MFGFLKIRLFRKKFILYLVVVFLLCAALCFGVCQAFLSARKAALRQEALKAFERTEATINAVVDSIDRYVLKVYGDQALVQDMRDLMNNDWQTYLGMRLQKPAGTPSIIDSIQEYAKEGGQSPFARISLHGETAACVFEFGHGQVDIRYPVANDDPLFLPNIQNGLVHSSVTVMGEMRFLLSSQYMFSFARQYGLPNLAAVDERGNAFIIAQDDAFGPQVFAQALAQGHGQESMREGGKTVHYIVHTPAAHPYQLVMAYSGGYLLAQNSFPVIAMVAGTLALYCIVMLMIALNMRHDAEFLNQIIGTIDQAKTGVFKPVKKTYNPHNEYGMIADSLNDMTKKLERHIHTEYLLKLQQQQTEMKALQHQINPHFLYNTLEIIRSAAVVHQDDAVADAITNLGQIYRGITRAGAVITLGEELSILNSYLDLMAFRHKDGFSYSTDIDPGLLEQETVKFWMQPIAENFFAHGYDTGSTFNLFVLNGYPKGDGWMIEMMDNGPGIEQSRLDALNHSFATGVDFQSESVGLSNVCQRLRHFYGEGFSMAIANNKDAGITVRICVCEEGEDARV